MNISILIYIKMECVQILAVITPEFSVTWSFFGAQDIFPVIKVE